MARSYRRILPAAIGVWLAAGPLPADPAASAGESPADLRPSLFSRVRRALSAGRDISSVTAVRLAAVVEMAGQEVGRMETIARREPREMREVLEIAGVGQTVTVLGDEVWIEDANGSVRPATGEERASALLAHGLLFHLYLDGSGRDFDVSAEAGGFRFRPSGGGPERILNVGDDFLPTEFVELRDGARVSTRFSDWRVTGGVRFPFESRQSTGETRFDVRIRTTAVEFPEDLPAHAIPLPRVGAPEDFELVDPAAARTIGVELVAGLVLVPVEVNGRPGRFLLDTGAGATILASAYADSLGLPSRGVMEARGAGGSESASFVDVDALSVPGVVLREQTVVTLPLDTVSDALGATIDGVLGYDFLSRFAVEIDYPRKRLALFPAGGYRPREEASRVPLRIEANVPRLEGLLGGRHRGSFLLDTGNSVPLLLFSPFVREHGLAAGIEDTISISGVGGSGTARRTVVDSLALGNAVFRNVETILSTADEGAVASVETIGNVGSGLFARTVLAFDYGAGALWIVSPATARSASVR